MPGIIYSVQIDWDDDGSFDGPGEALDRDVIAVEWALGLDDPADVAAAESWAMITLRDPAGHYMPENTSSPLYGSLVPRKKVRITSTYGGVTRTHFTGWTESFTPHPDRRTVAIRCTGVEALLRRAEVFLPTATDQTADAVIAAALDQVAYPPAISGYWLLGTARLGLDTRLPDTTTYADLERGRAVFAYVGGWRGGVSAWEAIRAVTQAERGLCFVDRAGRVIFWNRHHLLQALTVAASLDEREANFTVTHDGADMVNHAVITCHPREVGSSPEPLWTLAAPLAIPPGEARTIRARFTADDGERVIGLNPITPAAGTDYTASSTPDGSGADRTGTITVTMDAAASSAVLTFTNHGTTTAYVLPGAQVRGIRVVDRGPADVTYADSASITRYGRRTLGLNLPLIADPVEAGRLARHLVVEGKNPRGSVRTVTLRGEANADIRAAVLAQAIGSRIRLTDSRAGHSGEYHIVGERHMLRHGGTAHQVTWTLRAVSPVAYWRLGVAGAGELGQQTTLAY